MITYEEAYRRYRTIIEGYCKFLVGNRYYAEDVTSETFSILYEKWHSLNSHESKVILTWLYRTANNKIKEFYRNQPPEYLNIDDDSDISTPDLVFPASRPTSDEGTPVKQAPTFRLYNI